MNMNPQHPPYGGLTKRGDRLAEVSAHLKWTPNIWMGVSVEDHRVVDRIEGLRRSGAQVKFLSCEPLIGPLPELDLQGIDWVIVGGESGSRLVGRDKIHPRPMKEEWVLDIQRQCEEMEIDFFFKQWGGTNKKKAGRLLQGRTWDEMPQVALVSP
jgi:protein gp37